MNPQTRWHIVATPKLIQSREYVISSGYCPAFIGGDFFKKQKYR